LELTLLYIRCSFLNGETMAWNGAMSGCFLQSSVRVFGEAARSLGVSHPTVGRRIKALEDEAQQALFRRTNEGLVLTDAGDRVMTLAEAMEDSALAMERRLAGNHERLEGILRISSAEWFANYVLAPVLVELTRRHPAIVPEIIASYRLLNLSRRDADIAFRIVPFTEPDIVQRRLMSMPYALYGTPETAYIAQHDPAAVGLILMNTAQSHFSDVAWLLDRFLSPGECSPVPAGPFRRRCASVEWGLPYCHDLLAMPYRITVDSYAGAAAVQRYMGGVSL
jgi:DNA-binding transcriptional LysR family regulator